MYVVLIVKVLIKVKMYVFPSNLHTRAANLITDKRASSVCEARRQRVLVGIPVVICNIMNSATLFGKVANVKLSFKI